MAKLSPAERLAEAPASTHPVIIDRLAKDLDSTATLIENSLVSVIADDSVFVAGQRGEARMPDETVPTQPEGLTHPADYVECPKCGATPIRADDLAGHMAAKHPQSDDAIRQRLAVLQAELDDIEAELDRRAAGR